MGGMDAAAGVRIESRDRMNGRRDVVYGVGQTARLSCDYPIVAGVRSSRRRSARSGEEKASHFNFIVATGR